MGKEARNKNYRRIEKGRLPKGKRLMIDIKKKEREKSKLGKEARNNSYRNNAKGRLPKGVRIK